MRQPKNQVLENLYTQGDEFLLVKTYDNYVGSYHSIAGKYYVGATYNPKAIELVRYTKNREVSAYRISQLDEEYLRIKPSILNTIKRDEFDVVKINYVETKTPTYRFFIQRRNEINAPILEVNKSTFNNAELCGFYNTVSILWDISKLSLLDLSQAERIIPNLSLFLEATQRSGKPEGDSLA